MCVTSVGWLVVGMYLDLYPYTSGYCRVLPGVLRSVRGQEYIQPHGGTVCLHYCDVYFSGNLDRSFGEVAIPRLLILLWGLGWRAVWIFGRPRRRKVRHSCTRSSGTDLNGLSLHLIQLRGGCERMRRIISGDQRSSEKT